MNYQTELEAINLTRDSVVAVQPVNNPHAAAGNGSRDHTVAGGFLYFNGPRYGGFVPIIQSRCGTLSVMRLGPPKTTPRRVRD
jgi:hypothetical protein